MSRSSPGLTMGLKVAVALLGVALAPISCGPIAAARWTYHCATPLALGASCLLADECADGLRCAQGRCAVLARVGEVCENLHDCVAGNACHQTFTLGGDCMATTCSEAGRDLGSCQTTRPTGRRCSEDLTCRPLEVCASTAVATMVCRAIPGLGASCEGFIGWECAAGLVCERTAHTCQTPRLGGNCGINGEDLTLACGASLGCDARTDGTDVCIARAAEGGACSLESCQRGLHCTVDTRRCVRDFAAGASCSAGNECGAAVPRSLDCVASRCVAITQRGAVGFPGRYGCGGGFRCLQDR